MIPASATATTPRPEPEVLAAQVRAMLGPFFGGRDLGPVPVITIPVNNKPAPAARVLVMA